MFSFWFGLARIEHLPFFFVFLQLVNLGVIVDLTELLEVNPFYKKVTLKI